MAALDLPHFASILIEEGPRHRALYGGRSSAKSWTMATVLAAKASKQKLRILCVREIQASIAASVKQLIEDRIKAIGLAGAFKSTQTGINGVNGSEFMFAGVRTNPDRIKSTEGVDILWMVEANRISRASLDILRPTIRKPGSEIWADWNPDQPTDPVDEMFRGGSKPPPRTAMQRVSYHDNDWLSAETRAEIEWDKKRDPDRYNHVWLGNYRTISEAAIFKNWRVEEFEAPPDARFRFGADWGFSQDPTTLVRCFRDGRTLYVDHEAWRVGCPVVETPILFDRIPEARQWEIRADSARPELVDHMKRDGFRIVPATKGPGSVESGVSFLQGLDIVVHPRCEHTISEMSSYSYQVDRHTGEILPRIVDANNHVIDALRYAMEGDALNQGKFTHVAVPRSPLIDMGGLVVDGSMDMW